MRFSDASLLALVANVLAQTANFDPINKPQRDENIQAGSVYNIQWQASPENSGTVTVELLGGASPSTLQILGTLATGVDNKLGSFAWNVASNLGTDNTYGIKISYESDKSTFQYSFPFHIVAGVAPSSSHDLAASPTYSTSSGDDYYPASTSTSNTAEVGFATLQPDICDDEDIMGDWADAVATGRVTATISIQRQSPATWGAPYDSPYTSSNVYPTAVPAPNYSKAQNNTLIYQPTRPVSSSTAAGYAGTQAPSPSAVQVNGAGVLSTRLVILSGLAMVFAF